jgi:citrate synthase
MAYLTAAEAAAELGISVQTLYAYVSRGRLRSVAEGRSREHRIEKTSGPSQKKLYRGGPCGLPSLPAAWFSNPRLGDADGKSYRGRDAVELAAQRVRGSWHSMDGRVDRSAAG